MCIMVVGWLGSVNGSSLLLTKWDGAVQHRGQWCHHPLLYIFPAYVSVWIVQLVGYLLDMHFIMFCVRALTCIFWLVLANPYWVPLVHSLTWCIGRPWFFSRATTYVHVFIRSLSVFSPIHLVLLFKWTSRLLLLKQRVTTLDAALLFIWFSWSYH